MYMLKDGLYFKFNQSEAPTMNNIMNRKVACRKVLAFCITKYINETAEIEDYFEKVEGK